MCCMLVQEGGRHTRQAQPRDLASSPVRATLGPHRYHSGPPPLPCLRSWDGDMVPTIAVKVDFDLKPWGREGGESGATCCPLPPPASSRRITLLMLGPCPFPSAYPLCARHFPGLCGPGLCALTPEACCSMCYLHSDCGAFTFAEASTCDEWLPGTPACCYLKVRGVSGRRADPASACGVVSGGVLAATRHACSPCHALPHALAPAHPQYNTGFAVVSAPEKKGMVSGIFANVSTAAPPQRHLRGAAPHRAGRR